jgi:hypothetical protein
MDFFRAFFVVGLTACLASCGGGGGCASGASCTASASNTTTTFTASPSSAVSVGIGTGNKIETTAKEIKYRERYAITVVDALGKPVVGAKVTPSIQMLGFLKGALFRDATTFKVLSTGTVDPTTGTQNGPPIFCQAEDLNNNDVLDPGEDVNHDGALTPAKADVAAYAETSDLTNDQGIVFIIVEYPKDKATWIKFRLRATAAVTGTEGHATQDQYTSSAVGDEANASTPFVVSPYGIQVGCNNPN